MFEEMTFEVIMKRMLSRVDNGIDKREGSIIYDALAPAAVELQLMYLQLDNFLNEAFADTASREYLIRRAAERGLKPENSTCAVLKGVFTPETIDVTGKRFNCGELNYTVLEKISDGVYKLQCETEGIIGNKNFGNLIPIEYVDGLQTARLTELIVPGEDDEDTEVFRKRYINSLQSQAFGGNIADYKEKVLAIDDVGGVKVYRAEQWNGAGTVKLVVQDSDFGKPTTEFIDQLQTQIDPVMNSGEGIGLAPIGHQVTVMGVDQAEVNITADLTYADGYTFDDIKSQIADVLSAYFAELNREWMNINTITVFLMQIGAKILNIKGVLDITNIKIDGNAANIDFDSDTIIDIENCTFNNVSIGGN